MSYPSPPPSWGQPAPAQPGLYPLRPLGVGEILGAGIRVAWANLALLLPIALLSTLTAAGVQLWVLSAYGDLAAMAKGTLFTLPAGATAAELDQFFLHFRHFLVASGASAAIGLILNPVLAGLAASGAATGATRRTSDLGAVVRRLRGRWLAVILTSLLVSVSILGGFVLLIVPGLILSVALLPAAPIAAIEGARPVAAYKRSLVLSRGSRWRLFGVVVLAGLLSAVGGVVIGAVVGAFVGGSGAVSSCVTLQLVIAVVTAVVSTWAGAVNALLYIDLRLRKENLGPALAASA